MKFKKILLVDDDNVANFINQKLITNWQITESIETVMDARKALNDLAQQCQQGVCPDVILLDLNMPNFDGFDFIQAFQQLSDSSLQSIKIVVLTSSDDTTDMHRVQALGINRIINKPLTLEKLQHVFPEIK